MNIVRNSCEKWSKLTDEFFYDCFFIQIKKITRNTKKTDKFVRQGLPAVIKINSNHSHRINNAHMLSMLSMSSTTRDRFLTYFNNGMTPSAAISYNLSELEMTSSQPDLADASLNPLPDAVYHLHSTWRKEQLGGRSTLDGIEKLKEKLPIYSEAGNKVLISELPFCVAIVTPLMQRSHGMASGRDICFVDSTASCDADNHVITFMLVPSQCGAIPVGVLITDSTTEESYTVGFKLLKLAFEPNAFGGQQYPSVFMTDDSAAERNALAAVWPDSDQKLCLFHVAQALWRWLWKSGHGIELTDRKELILQFRCIMYAVTEEAAEEAMQTAMSSDEAGKYAQYRTHLLGLWDRRSLWCLAWRRVASMRGHHTNNFAEVTVRLYKDKVLSRCKAYNVVALIEFTLDVLERYYRNRLLAFAHCRNQKPYLMFEVLEKKCSVH